MAFTDSRLGPGTLTVGTGPGTEFGFQVSALALTPAVNSTDGTPTLADPEPPPLTSTTYSLDGSAINDFEATDGLQMFCYDNDGQEVDFVWTPNSDATSPAILTGKCTVHAFVIGGKVKEQLVTDFSWPCTGKPVWSGGSVGGAAREKGRKAAA